MNSFDMKVWMAAIDLANFEGLAHMRQGLERKPGEQLSRRDRRKRKFLRRVISRRMQDVSYDLPLELEQFKNKIAAAMQVPRKYLDGNYSTALEAMRLEQARVQRLAR